VSVPAGSGLAALLSQAAGDLSRLENERDGLRAELDTTRAALESERARPSVAVVTSPAPAADIQESDKRHVPAPIPNWTPLDLEPAARWLATNGIPLALVGPPGCGKSDLPKQVAAALGRPYVRISCSDGATEGRIIGRRDVKSGETCWTDGPLAIAFKRGWHLTLDELGAAPAGVLACAHDALASASFHVSELGETIQAAPGTWITATSNYLGSDRNDASHEQPISAALADRFVVFACDYLTASEETAILSRRLGLSAPAIKPESGLEARTKDTKEIPGRVSNLMADLRAAEKSGDLSGPYSRRRALDLVRLLLAWGGTEAGSVLAVRGALLDRHPPSQRPIVAGLVQRHLGIAVGAA
jgi:MoxR-like ATPase